MVRSVDRGETQRGHGHEARALGRGAPLNDALAVALVLLLRAQRAAAADLHLYLLQSKHIKNPSEQNELINSIKEISYPSSTSDQPPTAAD